MFTYNRVGSVRYKYLPLRNNTDFKNDTHGLRNTLYYAIYY